MTWLHFQFMASILQKHGKQLQRLQQAALERVRERADERRVHKYRVAVKRLRTLLRLTATHAPDTPRPKRTIKRMKAVFHAAGLRREAQVSAGLVNRLKGAQGPAAKPYLERLEKQGEHGQQRLKRHMKALRKGDPRRLSAYVAKATAGSAPAREKRTARKYVQAELRMARKLHRKGPAHDVLHEVRKHVKNAWHTLKLLQGADALDQRQRQLLEQLAPLQERLGQWHDSHVVLADLKQWKGRGAGRDALRKAVDRQLVRREMKVLQELEAVIGGAGKG